MKRPIPSIPVFVYIFESCRELAEEIRNERSRNHAHTGLDICKAYVQVESVGNAYQNMFIAVEAHILKSLQDEGFTGDKISKFMRNRRPKGKELEVYTAMEMSFDEVVQDFGRFCDELNSYAIQELTAMNSSDPQVLQMLEHLKNFTSAKQAPVRTPQEMKSIKEESEKLANKIVDDLFIQPRPSMPS